MARILTFFLSLHWAVVFALLAIASTIDGTTGFPVVLQALGIIIDGNVSDVRVSPYAMGAVATAFAVVTVLFLWTILTTLARPERGSRDVDEVAQMAFSGATGALTLLLLVSALQPVTGLFQAIGLQIAAVLGSAAAAYAERRVRSDVAVGEIARGRNAARLMAAGAAHDTLLARLSGRVGSRDGGEG